MYEYEYCNCKNGDISHLGQNSINFISTEIEKFILRDGCVKNRPRYSYGDHGLLGRDALVDRHRVLGGTLYHHHQGSCSILKMEAAGSFERSVSVLQTARHHIPKVQNSKSYKNTCILTRAKCLGLQDICFRVFL